MAINYIETKLFCVSKWQHQCYLFSETGFVSFGITQGISGILSISILNGLCTYATVAYSEILHRLTERIWGGKKKNQTQNHSEELSISNYVNSLSKTIKTNPSIAHISYTTTKLHTIWGRGHLKISSDLHLLKTPTELQRFACEYPFLHSFTKQHELPDLQSYRHIISCNPK